MTVGPISTNCWIYPVPGAANGEKSFCAVIDPGAQPDKIIAILKNLNLTPKYILLTHGHFDHIEALPQLVSAFRNTDYPQIAIHRLDSEFLEQQNRKKYQNMLMAATGDNSFIDISNLMPPADILLEEGSIIGPFTVLHIPGHTRGSVAFWDKEANVLFSGDTLFKGDYGRTDLPGGSEQQIISSLKRLFGMDPAIKVFPGHGETTTIGHEARTLLQ